MAEENRRLKDKIALRLPEGMRDRIATLAERNNRSTNAEIVARLERSFEEGGGETTVGISLEREIETLRSQIRFEADARQKLEERLARIESAGTPDLHHIEMRLHTLERKA